MKDHYRTLGVPRTASSEEIRDSFRRHAMRHHPDRHPELGDAAQFREIQEAYEVLSDPDRRRRYDRSLRPEDQLSPAPNPGRPPSASPGAGDRPHAPVWPTYTTDEPVRPAGAWTSPEHWGPETTSRWPESRSQPEVRPPLSRIQHLGALVRALLEEDDWFF